jgi:beta-phosphoglucomutase-like phosphatase (HAD superfamily)
MKRALRAVIFDMDGVLTDTEPVHFAATNAVLAEQGTSLTWQEYEPFIGTAEPAMWDYLETNKGLSGERSHFRARYNEEVLRRLSGEVLVLPGAREAVSMVKGHELMAGLASSSRLDWVKATLRGAGLEGQFGAIVSGDMVPGERGKPEPDIFLLTAEKLGVPSAHCLVLEDSPRGITAARRAKMFAVGVRSSYALDLSEADEIIDGIAAFDIQRYLDATS